MLYNYIENSIFEVIFNTIYIKNLNCFIDFVRFDFILEEHTNSIYFLEVNVCPNHREGGMLMDQIQAARLSIREIYSRLIYERLDMKYP